MTISRRTFMTASAALAGAILLPGAASASFCGNTPASVNTLFERLDMLVPEMMMTPARARYDQAFLDFSYTYMVALNGQDGQPAYHELDDGPRAACLQGVFEKSGATLAAIHGLQRAFTEAGVTGIPMDLLTLQADSFDGTYDVRRLQIAQAIALLDDPLVEQDDVLAVAAFSLKDAIRSIGDGDAQVTAARAWDASPHQSRQHFRRFLPVVSPAGDLVLRMAQIRNGAALLAV